VARPGRVDLRRTELQSQALDFRMATRCVATPLVTEARGGGEAGLKSKRPKNVVRALQHLRSQITVAFLALAGVPASRMQSQITSHIPAQLGNRPTVSAMDAA